jgi:uncharacterized membrane protein YtjA (UPF0391 family)
MQMSHDPLYLTIGLQVAAVTFSGIAIALAAIAKLVVLICLALSIGLLASGLARRA